MIKIQCQLFKLLFINYLKNITHIFRTFCALTGTGLFLFRPLTAKRLTWTVALLGTIGLVRDQQNRTDHDAGMPMPDKTFYSKGKLTIPENPFYQYSGIHDA
jgi:hypothetical protein